MLPSIAVLGQFLCDQHPLQRAAFDLHANCCVLKTAPVTPSVQAVSSAALIFVLHLTLTLCPDVQTPAMSSTRTLILDLGTLRP